MADRDSHRKSVSVGLFGPFNLPHLQSESLPKPYESRSGISRGLHRSARGHLDIVAVRSRVAHKF